MKQVYTGLITGTGAAISVTLGFVPTYVRFCNNTDGIILEWTPTMGAGKGLLIAATGKPTVISSNGVTASASTATFVGVTLGTAAVNTTGDQINYVAMRL